MQYKACLICLASINGYTYQPSIESLTTCMLLQPCIAWPHSQYYYNMRHTRNKFRFKHLMQPTILQITLLIWLSLYESLCKLFMLAQHCKQGTKSSLVVLSWKSNGKPHQPACKSVPCASLGGTIKMGDSPILVIIVYMVASPLRSKCKIGLGMAIYTQGSHFLLDSLKSLREESAGL